MEIKTNSEKCYSQSAPSGSRVGHAEPEGQDLATWVMTQRGTARLKWGSRQTWASFVVAPRDFEAKGQDKFCGMQ